MTGRRKFSELEANMAPKRRARIAQLAEELRNQVDLVQSGAEPHLSGAVLELLRRHPDGLTRHQIREKLGLHDTKPAEKSIVSALSTLRKNHKISPRDRKYVSA